MLMIELKREDPLEPLGFTVAGYRTADSRYLVCYFYFDSIDICCVSFHLLVHVCMCVVSNSE